ncbi:MAG: nucleotidyltransferase family protein [Elusimicrobia bacterium]|nr:nucleotidyltransferase family protein [Elusimicrobiota bacterium]
MGRLNKINEILAQHKADIKQNYKVKRLGIFGSYARGNENKNSDLDILIEFKDKIDFFDYLELEEYLTKILKVKVDLVMKKTLKPNIGKRILSEVIYV